MIIWHNRVELYQFTITTGFMYEILVNSVCQLYTIAILLGVIKIISLVKVIFHHLRLRLCGRISILNPVTALNT